MQDQNHPHTLKIIWEHIDDPHTDDLLLRVLELILNDPQEISPVEGFDKNSLTTLNEGVPVENENKSKPKE